MDVYYPVNHKFCPDHNFETVEGLQSNFTRVWRIMMAFNGHVLRAKASHKLHMNFGYGQEPGERWTPPRYSSISHVVIKDAPVTDQITRQGKCGGVGEVTTLTM